MSKKNPKDFVEAYYAYAKQTEKYSGIDFRFILAQAALESAWGGKAPGNMFFGIKARKSTVDSKKQLLTTTEILDRADVVFPQIISIKPRSDGKYHYIVKDWFRKYDTPAESFMDHADLFLTRKRYANAMKFRKDPYRFAEEIAKAGYATDPNYARVLQSVIKTIEKYLPNGTES